MSRGVNKVIIIGNLGQDPELRSMPNGNSVVNCSLATSESWKDKNTGEQKQQTEWHRVVVFGKAGEILAQYAHKGSKIYIEGKLKTRKWQDKGGVDRYTTEIHVEVFGGRVELLDSVNNNQVNQPSVSPCPAEVSFNEIDEEVPF